MDPVPDEGMSVKAPTTVAGKGYSFEQWGDLFNARQKLTLITFGEQLKAAGLGLSGLAKKA